MSCPLRKQANEGVDDIARTHVLAAVLKNLGDTGHRPMGGVKLGGILAKLDKPETGVNIARRTAQLKDAVFGGVIALVNKTHSAAVRHAQEHPLVT